MFVTLQVGGQTRPPSTSEGGTGQIELIFVVVTQEPAILLGLFAIVEARQPISLIPIMAAIVAHVTIVASRTVVPLRGSTAGSLASRTALIADGPILTATANPTA